MLSRAGLLVVVGSALAGVAGRILGIDELFVLGATGGVLVLLTMAVVRLRAPRLTVRRTIHPIKVHAGSASRVELEVRNTSARRSPLVTLHDAVTGTGGAHLLLAPLGPDEHTTAAYRLPTERRGLISVGPLALEQADPFGLTRRQTTVGRAAELTVLPRVVNLLPLPFSLGNDPLAGAEQPNHLGRGGEDFFALRPYVVGDDLRRVHWPSSARVGDLLIRQDEQPWQGRVSVLLDTRRAATDPAVFEDMVTAAASILVASRRRGDMVRLSTSSGLDSGFVAGHGPLDSLMEHLAVVGLDSSGSLSNALSAVARGTGSLVAVVGGVTQDDLDRIVASRARTGGLTVVHVVHDDPETVAVVDPTPDLAQRGRAHVVRVTGPDDLATAWNTAMGRTGARRR